MEGLLNGAIDYYTERAFGGVGLIMTCLTQVKDIERGFKLTFVSLESLQSFS